jgi:hypothetical protein
VKSLHSPNHRPEEGVQEHGKDDGNEKFATKIEGGGRRQNGQDDHGRRSQTVVVFGWGRWSGV